MSELVCFTLPYARYPFERALEGVAGAGYRFVGFGLRHAGVGVPQEHTPSEASRVARMCEAYRLQPSVLYGVQVMNLEVEEMQRRIDFAADVGAKMVVWLGPFGYRVFGYTQAPEEPKPAAEQKREHQIFLERVKPVAEHAATRGITITFKPHTGNTATARVLAKTLADVGHPSVRGCYDPGNVRFYEGISPEEDLEYIADEIHCLIAKDHKGARAEVNFPIPCEGDIDWVRIFRVLKQRGFDGPVVIERLDGTDREPASAQELDRRILVARENIERAMAQA